MIYRFKLRDMAETAAFASFLARYYIKTGDIYLVEGDMGSGKTSFCRLIAENMGLKSVASPTFTILSEHAASDAGIALKHFDLYRVSDIFEFNSLGFDEILDRLTEDRAFAYIEWPEIIAGEYDSAIYITIDFISEDKENEGRLISIDDHEERFEAVELHEALQAFNYINE